MQKRIVHLTSVHPRYDIRIFRKMCCSLASETDFDVYLVVADGKGDEVKDKINIIDAGLESNRFKRIACSGYKVFSIAKTLRADVYHIHDPELLPWARRLVKAGYKVIFDAHEDFPKQIKAKHYINPFLRGVISKLAGLYERHSISRLSYVVSATPSIGEKFSLHCDNVVVINNYPVIDELASVGMQHNSKKDKVCYVGSISWVRGIDTMIHASESLSSVQLALVGEFSDLTLRKKLKASRNWSNVIEMGFLDRPEVKAVLAESIAGLVTLLPTDNHIESLPNKMFEYMSASVPVIASNFPLWKEIIEKNNCGLCVDPESATELAEAIETLCGNPELAENMGRNGYEAISTKYNWEAEFKKLIGIYSKLLNCP